MTIFNEVMDSGEKVQTSCHRPSSIGLSRSEFSILDFPFSIDLPGRLVSIVRRPSSIGLSGSEFSILDFPFSIDLLLTSPPVPLPCTSCTLMKGRGTPARWLTILRRPSSIGLSRFRFPILHLRSSITLHRSLFPSPGFSILSYYT